VHVDQTTYDRTGFGNIAITLAGFGLGYGEVELVSGHRGDMHPVEATGAVDRLDMFAQGPIGMILARPIQMTVNLQR